jgi:hypothetical protein
VTFRGHETQVPSPAQIEVGAGRHVLEARRDGAVLTGAVISRRGGAGMPVTPTVVDATNGSVAFEAHAGWEQRVILRFAEGALAAADGAQATSEGGP